MIITAVSKSTAQRTERYFADAGQEIRLSGRNLTENEHVKLGAHHTLQLEPHRAFQLVKVFSVFKLLVHSSSKSRQNPGAR